MNAAVHVLLLHLLRTAAALEDVAALSELPFSELLAQKRVLEGGGAGEGPPMALALVGAERTFYEEDYDDEKGHVKKKDKDKDKLHDVLNTSIMALSYLAFGGYLLCIVASALREKRRRYAMTYATSGSTTGTHLAQLLQQHMTHRPFRPFIRFPAVTVHQGGRKRRKRLARHPPPQTPSAHAPPPASS